MSICNCVWCNDPTNPGIRQWYVRKKQISTSGCGYDLSHFARRILGVKYTTTNAIVFGDTGHLPPSLSCMISVLTFVNRLYHMSSYIMAERCLLNFIRYKSKASRRGWQRYLISIVNAYILDTKQKRHHFKYECKIVVIDKLFSWHNKFTEMQINTGLRTHQNNKEIF